MAVLVLTDARVEINSVALSDHVRQVTLNSSADEQESTAMGATYRAKVGGLKDWSVAIEFNQDFAGSSVDATIWPLLGTNTTVKVRPTSAAIAATNPEYSGSVLVAEYVPLGNSVGELATVSVTWPGAGTLSRAVSA